MSRGAEIALYQKSVLDKIPEPDKSIASEIFDARSSITYNTVMPLVHGFGIGSILWLILIQIIYRSIGQGDAPVLIDFGTWFLFIGIFSWLLYIFSYREKLQKSKEKYREMMEDENHQRVNTLMREKAKEIQTSKF